MMSRLYCGMEGLGEELSVSVAESPGIANLGPLTFGSGKGVGRCSRTWGISPIRGIGSSDSLDDGLCGQGMDVPVYVDMTLEDRKAMQLTVYSSVPKAAF
jgi:hypothetical protein